MGYTASAIDYNRSMYHDGRYVGMRWSDNQMEAMDRYLFDGLLPGGHMEAMLAREYERALFNADIHSRTVFWATAMWIRENVPEQAQGSYANIKAWCKSAELREQFRVECEKKYMWDKLKEETV